MKNYIIIKADTNDADYIEETSEVSDYNLEKVKSIIAKITKNVRHNWPNGEFCNQTVEELYEGILTQEEIDFFGYYIPQGEYGIHTIKSIEVIKGEKTKLF